MTKMMTDLEVAAVLSGNVGACSSEEKAKLLGRIKRHCQMYYPERRGKTKKGRAA